MNEIIITERLILKPLTLEDASSMFEYASDPEVSKYTLWHPHQSLEDSKSFIRSVLERIKHPNDLGTYGIFLKENLNQVIGTIRIGVDKSDIEGELTYALSRAFWQKGLTYEAAQHLVNIAFKEKGLEHIYAMIATENLASKALIQKLGMTYESSEKSLSYWNGRFAVERYGIKNLHQVLQVKETRQGVVS